ncbi:MAG TPA: flagellar protein FliS [Balneolaceae bacterium]|nr:flagellar biosynthesis protein FliS [Balneola sp.]HBQ58068.1 flagellar protein FliS [Balneolaceae bacterium]|tara:strand:- start:89938 stop:90249 length:312 start_codon:yes stop_codon:yes gene_type:complete
MENAQLAYQKQSVMDASPLKLVVKMYDLAIQASYREDNQKVRDILSTLIAGLDFEHKPADQLFELYRYCQELARKGKFEEFREILEPLRDTWEEAANQAIAAK